MASRGRRVLRVVVVGACLVVGAARAATITVTGTGDTVAVDGAVTLREAITSINAAANTNADVVAVGAYGTSDTIQFNIPGAGPHTITVGATPLPTLVRPMTIDGYTEPGSQANMQAVGTDAVLNVIVRGSTVGVNGLTIAAGGSGSTVRGLVLQSHFVAIVLQASNVTIAGNYIGTDAAGAVAVPNNGGIAVTNGNLGNNTLGGTTPAARNVISGNTSAAIGIESQLPNPVQGNYIGVNAAGTAALANGGAGVVYGSLGGVTIGDVLIGGSTAQPGTPPGNVIAGNGANGIDIRATTGTTIAGGWIRGNLVGLNATGTTAIPNAGTGILLQDLDLATNGTPRIGSVLIGGPGVGDRNVISGHGTGILARAVNVLIRGNYIGTDLTGTLARPNTFGIELSTVGGFFASGDIGGTGATEGNVIAGNASDGVRLILADVRVRRNSIGVGATGGALGNGGFGLVVDSSDALVGFADTDGNVIAHNGDTGVQVLIGQSAVRNVSRAQIQANRIFSNGGGPVAGLGINNSAPDVVTANDPGDTDTGPSGLQNFPVLTAASIAGGTLTVSGTLATNPVAEIYRIDVFSSTSCDALGHGEGESYLGNFLVATDAGGNATFTNETFPVPPGQPVITATATRILAEETSEFSACLTASGGVALPTLSIAGTSANEGNAGNTIFSLPVTLSAASATPVTVAYTTSNGTATDSDNDYLPTSGTLTFSPGGPLTQNVLVDVVGDTTVEPNELFSVTLASPTGATIAVGQASATIVNDDTGAPQPGPVEVPTLSQWGAALLALLLAGFALRRLGAGR
jgi:hypothetical protein